MDYQWSTRHQKRWLFLSGWDYWADPLPPFSQKGDNEPVNHLDFDSTIQALSNHELEELSFSYPGVGKYKSCSIRWEYDEFPQLGKKAPRGIYVRLGKSQEIRFHGPVKPDMIRFTLPGCGPLSLRDVWKKLENVQTKLPEE
ncbi:MAG: hypothetical protein K6E59_01955 [Bacilli bacterium]|nr:hypothetical protein [Bacilli bacterium]